MGSTTTGTMPAGTGNSQATAWKPQPGPQMAGLRAAGYVDELLFGGAMGGGKTDWLLGDFAQDVKVYGPAWRGILFRRSYPELEEIIVRSHEIYPRMGAIYNQGSKTWTWPSGAFLRLRYLRRGLDIYNYHGHSYTWVGWDELTTFPSMEPYHYMKTRLRSATPVERKRIRATSNPGGVCHAQVKAYFVDPAPHGGQVVKDEATNMSRMYLRSLVWDNKILLKADPGYIDRMRAVALVRGGAQLVKAWLYGQWDIVFGGMFDMWDNDTHFIEPFPVPESWGIDRSFDWGSASPFSVGWWAESDGSDLSDGRNFPRGTLFRLAEWYGWNGNPGEGCGLLPDQIAAGIKQREEKVPWGSRVKPGPADTQIWNADRGASLADEMLVHGVKWMPADKRAGSRATRWERMRAMLMHSKARPMERPGLFVFKNCLHFQRTVPVLTRDESNPDDIADHQEDHIADEAGYRIQRKVSKAKVAALVGF